MNEPKPRIATVWLGGCSGCHMSFLDLDERLIDLAQLADVVFTPIADFKVFPEAVDVTLVEGAVANTDHLEQGSTPLVLIRPAARTAEISSAQATEPVAAGERYPSAYFG